MNVDLRIRGFRGSHDLTVVARPKTAALLGEYVLMECRPMPPEGRDGDTAVELLRQAYRMMVDTVRELGDTLG